MLLLVEEPLPPIFVAVSLSVPCLMYLVVKGTSRQARHLKVPNIDAANLPMFEWEEIK